MWMFKADFRSTGIKCDFCPLYFPVKQDIVFFHATFLNRKNSISSVEICLIFFIFFHFSIEFFVSVVLWIYFGKSLVFKREKKNEFSELFFIYAVFVYMFASKLSLIFFINV